MFASSPPRRLFRDIREMQLQLQQHLASENDARKKKNMNLTGWSKTPAAAVAQAQQRKVLPLMKNEWRLFVCVCVSDSQ